LRKSHKQGLSIAEILIGATLALLIGGLALDFLTSLYHSATRAAVRDSLQSKASVALTRMVSEMRQTTVSALETTPAGLGFTRLHSITGTGQKVWEERSLFYFWDEPSFSLYKRECPPTPSTVNLPFSPSRPPHLTEQHLNSLFDPQSEQALMLTDHAKEFVVERDGSLLTVTLTLEQKSTGERLEKFSTSRSLKLRNS
jgi:hypothetical protein